MGSCSVSLRHQHLGLTLNEFIFTAAALTILLGLGIPSMARLLRENSVLIRASQFISLVDYARSEAVRRHTPVTLCPASPARNRCGDDADNGFLIRAGRKILKDVQPANPEIHLRTGHPAYNPNVHFSFNSDGSTTAGRITVSQISDDSVTRVVRLTAEGKASVVLPNP